MEFIYKVDKEAKSVVCIITEREQRNAIINDLRKATVQHIPTNYGWTWCEYEDLVKRWDYHLTKSVGKAVCYGDDKFDLETGKSIARKKALEKYYSKRRKIFQFAIREYEWTLYNLYDKIRPYSGNDPFAGLFTNHSFIPLCADPEKFTMDCDGDDLSELTDEEIEKIDGEILDI